MAKGPVIRTSKKSLREVTPLEAKVRDQRSKELGRDTTRIPFTVRPEWRIRINGRKWEGRMLLTQDEICNVLSLASRRWSRIQKLNSNRGFDMHYGRRPNARDQAGGVYLG